MNFFEQQQRARRRTWLLAALFVLAVSVTVLLANAVVLGVVTFYAAGGLTSLSPVAWARAHPQAALWTSAATLAFIAVASLARMRALRRGGGALVRALGGTFVHSGADDPRRRQLRNVVQEMAIAAGVPVPEVYVLEEEQGINAFAAGFAPGDAAIAVTRGTLEYLDRDELQGVIAHEFSHILNGDMRLNMRLLGVLNGIQVIGQAGRGVLRSFWHRSYRRKRRGSQAAGVMLFAAIALVAIGWLGTLFGTMIRAAVSRQREFLADAAAVQFTRNPAGIAGALKKIAASPLRAVLQTADAEELGHMLIADGRKLFRSMFATHPPLLERIRSIERRFDPAELERVKLVPVPGARVPGAREKGNGRTLPLSPALVVASVGELSADALADAARREAELPAALVRAARSTAYAPSLVLALVLSKDAGERAAQIDRAGARLPHGLCAHLAAFHSLAASLAPERRMPLIALAFPALRQRPRAELVRYLAMIDELVRADGRYDVLDYALVRFLRVQLGDAAAPGRAHRQVRLGSLKAEARVLLAVLASAGGRGEAAARTAYQAGMNRLFGKSVPPFALERPWVAALDRALGRLDALAPRAKQALVEALVLVIRHDRRISLGETELLRAVCASLHCPLPPLDLRVESAGKADDGSASARAP